MASRELRSLDQMMDGALTERFNAELAKLWDNVFDPNTDPMRTRTISLIFKFKPNERRDAADMMTDVQLKLASPTPLTQTVLIEQHDDGSVTAIERTSQVAGQIDIEGEVNIPRVIEFKSSTPQS